VSTITMGLEIKDRTSQGMIAVENIPNQEIDLET
jgi:hypothetical protein